MPEKRPSVPPGGWLAFWMLAFVLIYVLFGLVLFWLGVL